VVILLVIGGRLVIDFGRRIVEGQDKIAQQDSLEAEIRRLQLEQGKLQADKTYYSSAAYVEAWAHSEGKMVRPGEKIVIPLYKGQPRPKPPVIPPAPAPPAAKWVTWWTLFFDTSPPSGQSGGASRNP
jgi:cell division protein FtsL